MAVLFFLLTSAVETALKILMSGYIRFSDETWSHGLNPAAVVKVSEDSQCGMQLDGLEDKMPRFSFLKTFISSWGGPPCIL